LQFLCGWQYQAPFKGLSVQNLPKPKYLLEYRVRLCVIGQIATNVMRLGEVPPCRMLNYSTKACGGILPNHCYKPFFSGLV